MLAENFIVKGKVFFNTTDQQVIQKIREGVIYYLRENEFYPMGANPEFYNFGSLLFTRDIRRYGKVDFFLRIRRFLHLSSEQQYLAIHHTNALLSIRDEIPYDISIEVYHSKIEGVEGNIFEITVKPAIFFKVRQAGYNRIIDKEQYSYILTECKQTFNTLAHALRGQIIDPPKALDASVETKVIEQLTAFRFLKTAELLKKGRSDIELGETLTGTDNLRGAIENFVSEAVIKLGKKPKQLHEIKDNFDILAESGGLSTEKKRLAFQAIISIHTYLSYFNHTRETPDLITARFCFDDAESIFQYLIERLIRYRIIDPTELPKPQQKKESGAEKAAEKV